MIVITEYNDRLPVFCDYLDHIKIKFRFHNMMYEVYVSYPSCLSDVSIGYMDYYDDALSLKNAIVLAFCEEQVYFSVSDWKNNYLNKKKA